MIYDIIMEKVQEQEFDGISVKELDDNRIEVTLGEKEFKSLSAHAEEAKMTLEEYIVSLITDYIDLLEQNLGNDDNSEE